MRKASRKSIAAMLGLSLGAASFWAHATIPPAPGQDWPPLLTAQRLQQFQFTRSLMAPTQQMRLNRLRMARGEITRAAASSAPYGMVVSGTRSIPVLTATFANSPGNPYPAANLQRELFDGPWPTGTMTDFYLEMSYGQLTVNGTVFDWFGTAQNDTHYEGPAGCNGLCNSARVGEFIVETLDQADGSIDFGDYDNDGPDGVPNSGDDDGFVDFVAFVHPEAGGECGNNNIWSHRWVLAGWNGQSYETDDDIQGNPGVKIRIDDYVIQPAFACNGTTMIEIGVFAHEFGHAFGLPDLYDTNTANGTSAGIGNWGLMAAGSWGGDNQSPDRPSHMSAWSKEYLGWVTPTEVVADELNAAIANAEQNAVAYKMAIDADEYYLLENRRRIGFDDSLRADGLAIWRINETVVNAGLANNSVNADENNQGVELVEADGNNSLDNNVRSEPGDLYAGGNFDVTTSPASRGSNAVCNISAPASTMTADLKVSTNRCATGPGGVSISLNLNPSGRLGQGDTATLTATVRDAANSPLPGATVTFASANTSLATVSPASAVTDASGQARTTVTGRSGQRASTQITAQTGGTTERISIDVPTFGGLHWSVAWIVALLVGWLLRRRLFVTAR